MDDATHEPLRGAIICCTSVPPEQRQILAGYAEQMGAVHKYDLTSDVTHLVVGATDTPKYKFVAKERLDVKCVKPTWLEAVRAAWLDDSVVDIAALEEEYKSPTFHALNICVTGFVGADERKDLEDKITLNGGDYKPNLTREEHFLIAKEAGGPKYEFAEKWDVKIVTVDWLEQSIERGMILEHSLFHPLIPPEKRGVGAWIRKTASPNSLGKHAREDKSTAQRPRRLRRTASARLENQNTGLWGDIASQDVKPKVEKNSAWDEDVAETVAESTMTNRPENAKRDVLEQRDRPLSDKLGRRDHHNDIFYNKVFVLYGFNEHQLATVERHMRSRGASFMDYSIFASRTVTAMQGEVHVIVPYRLPRSQLPDLIMQLPQQNLATELWVERCMHQKKYESPTDHATSQPFQTLLIGAFENLSVSVTGFQSFDLLHTSKAIKALGGSHEEDFTSTISLLLCNSGSSSVEKLRHAQLWKIPAVRVDWLWECIRRGEWLDPEEYLIQPIASPNIDEQENKEPNEISFSSNILDQQSDSFISKAKSSGPLQKSNSFNGDPRSRRKDTLQSRYPKPPRVDPFADSAGPPINAEPEAPGRRHAQVAVPVDPTSQSPNRRRNSHPLQEITPNSSPPKQAPNPNNDEIVQYSIPKPSPPPSKPPSQDAFLAETITSLLAAQRSSTTTTSNATTSKPLSQPRRRRQLLGRAPSNLSMNSRASSVDTAHSTPQELTIKPPLTGAQSSSTVIYDNDHAEQEERARHEEQMQMTQLGYEDLEQKAWRKRVDQKIRGATATRGEVFGGTENEGKVRVRYGKGVTPRKGVRGAGATSGAEGSLGIAKRTRGATAR